MQRSLNLRASARKCAHKVEYTPENRVGECDDGRSLNDPGKRFGALCVLQGRFEICLAEVEQRLRAKQPHLGGDIAAFFGNFQASAQSHTRCIASSSHETQ